MLAVKMKNEHFAPLSNVELMTYVLCINNKILDMKKRRKSNNFANNYIFLSERIVSISWLALV